MSAEGAEPAWSFLSTQGLALLVIAQDPCARIRDIADAIGVTERTGQRVVTDLVKAGYVVREQAHGRNTYTIRSDVRFRLPVDREVEIGDLLGLLATAASSTPAPADAP